MRIRYLAAVFILAGLVAFASVPIAIAAESGVQDWEVLNPAGTIAIKPIQLAPRLTSLEGKTVVLRWNGKHNGNNYLDRIAELFAQNIPSVKVVKLYELDKSTIKISGSNQESARIAGVIKGLKADLVIASQAD